MMKYFLVKEAHNLGSRWSKDRSDNEWNLQMNANLSAGTQDYHQAADSAETSQLTYGPI